MNLFCRRHSNHQNSRKATIKEIPYMARTLSTNRHPMNSLAMDINTAVQPHHVKRKCTNFIHANLYGSQFGFELFIFFFHNLQLLVTFQWHHGGQNCCSASCETGIRFCITRCKGSIATNAAQTNRSMPWSAVFG